MNRKYRIQNAPPSHQKGRKKTTGYGKRGKNRAQNLFHVVLFVMENRFLEREEVTPAEAKNKVKNEKKRGWGELKNNQFSKFSEKKPEPKNIQKWHTWKPKEMWMRIIATEPKDWKWKDAKKRKEKKQRWKRTNSYMKWIFFWKINRHGKQEKRKTCDGRSCVVLAPRSCCLRNTPGMCSICYCVRLSWLFSKASLDVTRQVHDVSLTFGHVESSRADLAYPIHHCIRPLSLMMTSLSQGTVQVLGPGHVYRIAQTSCQGSRSLSTVHLSSQVSAGEPHYFFRGNFVFFFWVVTFTRKGCSSTVLFVKNLQFSWCMQCHRPVGTILVVWQLVFTEHIIAQSCYTSPNNISTFP